MLKMSEFPVIVNFGIVPQCRWKGKICPYSYLFRGNLYCCYPEDRDHDENTGKYIGFYNTTPGWCPIFTNKEQISDEMLDKNRFIKYVMETIVSLERADDVNNHDEIEFYTGLLGLLRSGKFDIKKGILKNEI
jgi:hypothetical protein